MVEGAGRPEDRRQSERIPARVEVRFKQPAQAARALRAYSLNLSVGGLCLKTDRHYEVGAPLKLTLDTGGETFDLTGVVAWVRGGAIGVRFENMAEDQRQRLEALVGMLKSAPAI